MAHLDRVVVFERTDGGISILYVDERDRLEGETDDALIERVSVKHGAAPHLSGSVKSIIGRDKVKATSKSVRSLINGEVVDDPAKIAAKEAKKAAKQSVLSKLKITEDEAKALLGV